MSHALLLIARLVLDINVEDVLPIGRNAMIAIEVTTSPLIGLAVRSNAIRQLAPDARVVAHLSIAPLEGNALHATMDISWTTISFANPGRARKAALVQIARSADLWQIELAQTSARSVMEDIC